MPVGYKHDDSPRFQVWNSEAIHWPMGASYTSYTRNELWLLECGLDFSYKEYELEELGDDWYHEKCGRNMFSCECYYV